MAARPARLARTFVADDKFLDVNRELEERGWKKMPTRSPVADLFWRNYGALQFSRLSARHFANHVVGSISVAHKAHFACIAPPADVPLTVTVESAEDASAFAALHTLLAARVALGAARASPSIVDTSTLLARLCGAPRRAEGGGDGPEVELLAGGGSADVADEEQQAAALEAVDRALVGLGVGKDVWVGDGGPLWIVKPDFQARGEGACALRTGRELSR